MGVSTHFDVVAIDADAHQFSADVRTITSSTKPFVTLELNVGRGQVKFLLPVSSYQGARNIADIWPTLGDPTKATPRLSAEALAAIVSGAKLRGDVEAAEAAE